MIGKITVIIVGKICAFVFILYRLNHLIDSFLKGFFPSFCKQDFSIVHQSNGRLVVVMVVYEMVQVDEVGFMGTKKILIGQAAFYIFQDARKKVFLSAGGNNLSIPSVGNAAKDIFHPQEFDSPGGLNRYS